MNVGEIIKKWEECGVKSLPSFTLSNHYSILFDDDEEGFDYLINEIGVDKDELLKSTDPKTISIFEEIDECMEEVRFLIEDFITSHLLGKGMDLEDVKDGVEYLKTDMSEVYQKVYGELVKLKKYLKEDHSDEEISVIH